MEPHKNWWFVDVFPFRRKHFQVWCKFRHRKQDGWILFFLLCFIWTPIFWKKTLAPLLHQNKCDISTQLGNQISFYQIEEESEFPVPNSLLHQRYSCHISWSNLRSSQGLRLRSGGIACCMACMARKLKQWRLIMNLTWVQLRFAVATWFFVAKSCYGSVTVGWI